nr:immunoglobulin heavy chain junction region [Macaca mulatta]MOW46119.1 immunoglobulin heavy chain junction region [Macaca mulatta]MOW46233.1 immunoglobulin heavy chain junction region [Macaca mulatta]MOW48208.1 immunoglobulin heavy chain junction region [Macaca mulatta]MOW49402.1 immunoglobulin heavy chain junction region [Macaca mulatta]
CTRDPGEGTNFGFYFDLW